MRKINCFILVFVCLLLFVTTVHSYEIENFDITVVVKSSNSADVLEKWFVDFTSEVDKQNFKSKLLQANINVSMLEKIDYKLKPKIFINDYSNLKIGFDEINNFVSLSYNISDLTLIKYLDRENESIWRLNDNLFRYFVSNNLYTIPKNSYIRISLPESFIIGETSSKNVENNFVLWAGINSNELRLIVIEKKPPKPSFVISNVLEGFYLNSYFGFFILFLLLIIIVSLIFKKKLSKNIKKFVVNHSKIRPSKKRKEIIDFDYFNK
jgi:hypothetical protein